MYLSDNVIQALRDGQKVRAIKILREETGMGLTEAKAAIDTYVDDGHPLHPLSDAPTVQSTRNPKALLGTVAVIGTLIWMMINIVNLAGSAIILKHIDGYQRAVFTVTELRYRDDSESGLFWGFRGTVEGRNTKFYAPDMADAKKLGARKLRQMYPKGHEFEVWYNPEVTDTLFQQRTLHVVSYVEDLKGQETEKILWWVNYCLVPFVLALFIARRLE